MAKNVNIEKIRVEIEGTSKLTKLSSTFTKLNKNVSLTPKELNKTIQSITAYDRRGQRSVNTFNKQIAALKQLKDNVGIGSVAYKRLGEEIDRLSAKYDKLMGKQQRSGGFFNNLKAGARAGGKTALGASVGRFLPAGAQAGAAAGYLSTGTMAGGVAGAGIGLAVDATVASVRYAADAASYAAEIEKLRIALRGVTKDQETYQKGLQIISSTSRRLNVPIAASTKQFTTLSASVLGAGGSIEDAQVVFEGVSNAIKATGGNAEDVQSAIRAMSQIFGKGKVSAEELQGQLGERLAGAVVKFAEANGSSLQKLQKDLRDGTVGLDQVIKFAKKLNVDFAKTATEIANSSADAGQRLKTTMDLLKLAIGETVQPIGAAFQRSFSDMTLAILDSKGAMMAINGTLRILGSALYTVVEGVRFLIRTLVDLYKIQAAILSWDFKKAFEIAEKGLKETGEQAKLNAKIYAEMWDFDPFGLTDKDDKFKPKSPVPGLATLGVGEDKQGPLGKFAASAFNVAKQIEDTFVKAFKGMEDALVNFVTTGKLNFSDLARSIISDLTRMLVRAAITKPLFGWMFPNLKTSANGNVFAANGIQKFARGGIVDRPTLFPFKDGTGLMGEAGPEAIMPLKRGADGKLGVQSSGGVGNIVVNVDASGSSVQGDGEASKQFGRALASAIQSEMIKQKRPGGLLT